jgi:hypothetical protein
LSSAPSKSEEKPYEVSVGYVHSFGNASFITSDDADIDEHSDYEAPAHLWGNGQSAQLKRGVCTGLLFIGNNLTRNIKSLKLMGCVVDINADQTKWVEALVSVVSCFSFLRREQFSYC